MAGWRPTEYKKLYIKKSEEYLKKCKDDLDIVMSQQVISSKGISQDLSLTETKTTNIWLQNVKLPSIEWLAKYINISRSTIYLWRDEHPEFSDILEKILEEQADRLINMWLAGRYNWTITKLLLAKHWYIEKQEIDSTVEVNWWLDITNWWY